MGCKNVEEIPVVAEAVPGGHFYDFYYEVEQILVKDPNREKDTVSIAQNRGRNMEKEVVKQGTPGARVNNPSPGLGLAPSTSKGEKQDIIRESQESVESDDSLHTTLLIDTMAQEQDMGEDGVSSLDNEKESVPHIFKSSLKLYSDVVRSCSRVNEVNEYKQTKLGGGSTYRVELPDEAGEDEVIPTPPLVTEENLRSACVMCRTKRKGWTTRLWQQ